MDGADIGLEIGGVILSVVLTVIAMLGLYHYIIIPKIIVGVKKSLIDWVEMTLSNFKLQLLNEITGRVEDIAGSITGKYSGKAGGVERVANIIVEKLIAGDDIDKSKYSSDSLDRAMQKLETMGYKAKKSAEEKTDQSEIGGVIVR